MWWNLTTIAEDTSDLSRKANSENFFRKAVVLMLFLSLFGPAIRSQVNITPDAPGYCFPIDLTLTYTGVWGPNSNWSIMLFGVIPIEVSDQPTYLFSPDPWFFPSIRVTAYDASGLIPYYVEDIDPNVVWQPSGPGPATRNPDNDVCEGELVSATFGPGGGGIELQ